MLGPLAIDRLKHIAFAGGKKLDLTPREFQLIEHFVLHPAQVVRRTELLEKVWDMHFDPESNVVDVHVGNQTSVMVAFVLDDFLKSYTGNFDFLASWGGADKKCGDATPAVTIETLKLAVCALREERVPFMLGGSLAAWARGGPQPKKDLDLMVKPEDAERALEALRQARMRPERPPEEWLLKAWHDGVLVDLIFQPSGLRITDEVLGRADTLPVMAVGTPVMALEDVLVTMLMALDEHSLDYTRLVAIARSLREQVDWTEVRARTAASPYARGFMALLELLSIVGPGAATLREPRVRVVPGG